MGIKSGHKVRLQVGESQKGLQWPPLCNCQFWAASCDVGDLIFHWTVNSPFEEQEERQGSLYDYHGNLYSLGYGTCIQWVTSWPSCMTPDPPQPSTWPYCGWGCCFFYLSNCCLLFFLPLLCFSASRNINFYAYCGSFCDSFCGSFYSMIICLMPDVTQDVSLSPPPSWKTNWIATDLYCTFNWV